MRKGPDSESESSTSEVETETVAEVLVEPYPSSLRDTVGVFGKE